MYRNYKRHGHKPADKIRVDAFREECIEAIQKAKTDYLGKLGNKLADPSTCRKSYWKIVNRVMNRCKAPKISLVLNSNGFIFDAKEKANEFNEYFSSQCKPLANDSTLPCLHHLTNGRLNHIPFTAEGILVLIRTLNKNKSCGPDGISARMLSLCDDSIIMPLKLIFINIVASGN